MKLFKILLVPFLLLFVMTGTAEAKRPVPVPSIVLVGTPVLGGDVSFVTDLDGTKSKNPRVQIICRQGGDIVYGAADYPTEVFTLGGGWSEWLANGGAADCRADFFDGTTGASFAYTTFTASG